MTDTVNPVVIEEVEVDQGSMPIPTGYRLLIQPIKVREKTAGGIVLPEEAQNAEKHLRYVGKVVSMGQLCYRHEKFKRHPDEENPQPWCKVGDYVAYGQYAGQEVSVRLDDGLDVYRLVNDDEVLAVIPDPSAILAYV